MTPVGYSATPGSLGDPAQIKADTTFIVGAHNDLPALLSDLSRKEAEIAARQTRLVTLEAAIMDLLDPRCIGEINYSRVGRVEYFRDNDRSRAALINLRAALAGEPNAG